MPLKSPRSDEQTTCLAYERFEAQADEFALAFQSAKPFPHLVLEEMLTIDPALAGRFPGEDWPHWQRMSDGYQRGKASCSEFPRIPSPWHALISELSSTRFLRFLERVTGIPKLIPDPHLVGGGLHGTGSGGILAPHSDFHIYDALDLYRRVNVLVYLNADWQVGCGGELALYEAGERGTVKERVQVPPRWGNCVVFATDDRSVHGVNPVAEGFFRRSIALYYYTAAETPHFAGDRSTHWRTHGERKGVRGLRVRAYQVLMKVSRFFSMAAHLANPNFGMRALRERLGRRPAGSRD